MGVLLPFLDSPQAGIDCYTSREPPTRLSCVAGFSCDPGMTFVFSSGLPAWSLWLLGVLPRVAPRVVVRV